MSRAAIEALAAEVAACRRCPRLVAHRETVARDKRRAYADWNYWGRGVPGFGAHDARLLLVGLAPAAHGANRTGRMFTGDRSGDWLYRALMHHGFANRAESTHRGDGLLLQDCYVTAAARCAPPDNKPTPDELAACQPFLLRELTELPVRVVMALGQIAFRSVLDAWRALGRDVPKPIPRFAHLGETNLGGVVLLGSYHPSQRNTQTGFLTRENFDAGFVRARVLLGERQGGPNG